MPIKPIALLAALPLVMTPVASEQADRQPNRIAYAPQAPPTPPSGDCDAWLQVFAHFGADTDEQAWWRPIIKRETGCGRDMLNESTGDSGICQINPIHNRAGWFGRVEYGEGGWLEALHGLRTRRNLDSIEWVDACRTLLQVCGTRPWRAGDYGCDHRRLP